MPTPTRPESLPFSGDPEADRLLAEDPFALLVGFVLDQQVTVQKAFAGPAELRRRLGHLDPGRIATMDADALADAFRTPPALHRFPGSMAERVRALAAAIATDHEGDADRVWEAASSATELEGRLRALPGIGEMKARTILAILVRRFGLRPEGWETAMPSQPTLADVDSSEALAAYQAGKRAAKAAARAGASRPEA